MTIFAYMMIVEPGKDRQGEYYCAFFPDAPGCSTMGNTLEELRKNGKEALGLYFESLEEDGLPVPQPHVCSETVLVDDSKYLALITPGENSYSLDFPEVVDFENVFGQSRSEVLQAGQEQLAAYIASFRKRKQSFRESRMFVERLCFEWH